ncbi:MAG: tRNA pseudouridine(38-40) synthase TruA [Treponema sp.]|nr:tRNA pseudouridine(38-40) synthase TruA [Treponema sp.]
MPNDEKESRNIKLLLSYDGTDFFGWQRQEEGRRTVQAAIEEALEKLHKRPVTITGSGRTDTGVHAAAQVANFYTCIENMEASRFVPALNSILPKDVRILDAIETRKDFHSRFDARIRTYRYFFLTGKKALPWELRYALHLRRMPCIKTLNSYAELLSGEMDCTAFAVPGDKSKSRHRYIYNAKFFIDDEKLIFEISANAFLWKMVRSIAGTLIRFEEKGLGKDYLLDIIRRGDRSLTGPTAPPRGLFLWSIEFD